jgi:hypothetical protein
MTRLLLSKLLLMIYKQFIVSKYIFVRDPVSRGLVHRSFPYRLGSTHRIPPKTGKNPVLTLNTLKSNYLHHFVNPLLMNC